MGGRRFAARIAAVVASVLLIVAGNPGGPVPGGGRATAAEPRARGTIVFAVEQEPQSLNTALWDGYTFWTHAMLDNLLPDAYAMLPDFTFAPEVIDGEAVVTTEPFSVTYSIKDEAVWNDGTPVSAADFVFTWRTNADPENNVWNREGYDLIESARVIDPTTVTFEFRKPYPDYQRLFADVLPEHLLADKNFNRVWRNHVPISAGPFELLEWDKGSHLTLVHNDDYWGDDAAHAEEVVFRFMPRLGSQIDALADGDVHAIYPPTHPRLAQVRDFSDVEVQSSPSAIWEHLDFQFARALTRKPFIRKAIATAIDREAIVNELIRPIDPDAAVLQNLLFLTNQPGYEEHFDGYAGDAGEAQRILEDHGCAQTSEGIYQCEGRPLKLRYVSTSGNKLRERLAQMIRDQLRAAGIRLEVILEDPAVAFGTRLLSGRWHLFNFAWVRDGNRGLDIEIWRCEGSSNFNRYCNAEVTELLKEAKREIDPARRASLFDEADEVMARTVPSLPLYQRPTFLAYSERLQGFVDNPTEEGPTWNIHEWRLKP